MEQKTAEILIARILSGTLRLRIQDIDQNKYYVYLKNCSNFHKYIACEVYEELVEEALDAGMFDEQELKDFLSENNIWNDEKENRLNQLYKDIEELKVKMFGLIYKSNELAAARKVLSLAKNDTMNLLEEKNFFNHLSATGFAEIEKNKFLLSFSLFDKKNQLIFDDEIYWQQQSYILEQVIHQYRDKKIGEQEVRWLARNEPWRSYWMTKKLEKSFFGSCSIELNEEQRNIVVWSSIYDNIYENPNQPPEFVINEDDLIDGWMIIQRRKREEDISKGSVQDYFKSQNERINNAGEVFIPVNTVEDAQRVSKMNDIDAEMSKRKRLNQVRKEGEVQEVNMREVRMDLRKKANEKFKERLSG